MSNIKLRHVVAGEIKSNDSELLDQIEAELPNEDSVVAGDEYYLTRGPHRDENGEKTGDEKISGSMTFAPDEDEFTTSEDGDVLSVVESDAGDNEVLKEDVNDGDIFGPAEAAQQLFDTITSHDLANKANGWELRLYKSPQGGMTQESVQQWYKEDESRQPRDENDESYVPESFNIENHIVAEASSE